MLGAIIKNSVPSINEGKECNPFMACIPRIGTVHKGTALQGLP